NYQWNIPQLSNMTIMFLSILVILSFIIFIHKKYIQSLALIILSLIIVSYTAHSHVPTLTSFDVGQGDSLLYQTSRNHNILIDT
ncbi:DNA internalization-related competence protein ComEC/Rec2, partial [Staphylococcus pasteuri]